MQLEIPNRPKRKLISALCDVPDDALVEMLLEAKDAEEFLAAARGRETSRWERS